MNSRYLLVRSKAHFDRYPLKKKVSLTPLIFTQGAHWMMQRLNEIDGKQRSFAANVPYEFYGYFKYLFCLLFFVLSGIFLWQAAIYLSPLAILVFYFFEVHLLFLFPLLIERAEKPFLQSVRMTYRIGILSTIKTILPIGIFMALGLFRWRNPFYNWHLGCLAVLIWYVDEKH